MPSKYELAKKKADEIDNQIINALQAKKSFRVEAGAGSGKTYSLNRVIDWLQDNWRQRLNAQKQNVACITYTNAAVNVISSRLRQDSFIKPMTIHSFAWELISQFSTELKNQVVKHNLMPENITGEDFDKVQYQLGARYVENRILYLYHSDVINLFEKFMDNTKFRKLLTLRYPIILIDEYQDSLKIVIDQFLKYFINKNSGPQFGFFGDEWQTIYDQNSCGKIDSSNLVVIAKESNFRSQQIIVDVLNNIRPDLPQIAATDENDGFVRIITCNDFTGKRQDGYYKDELPNDILAERIYSIQKKLDKKYNWESEEHITLMITHKMLAKQQDYTHLLELLDERLKDGEDAYIKFFSETIEKLYVALESKRLTQLFDALGSGNYPIKNKKQKHDWMELKKDLEEARGKTVGDVMNVVCNTVNLYLPIPPKVLENHKKFLENPEHTYERGNIGDYYKISYSEVLNAISFLKPDAVYSTDHGVKGEEYNNVLWVVGRGWNNYQFDKFMGCNPNLLNPKNYDAYIRNRNLFYVCCSRPRKRLVLFITVPVKGDFLSYIQNVFGMENICLYSEFMNEK